MFNLVLAALLTVPPVQDDWPMWRHDAARSAIATGELPEELRVVWRRTLPPLKPAFRSAQLQFDAGYEPVIAGGSLYFGSSRNDSITALDAATGKLRWRFFTDGPVRFAPVAWKGSVYVGSDDGHVYCLNAEDGALRWKFRAVPSSRKLLGNGRLISVWPVRGGPVIADGTLYFAAGVWSFEGAFVYALDARTGKVKWLNDRTGTIFGQHPHNASAFGGLTPQGYLVVHGDDLIVPCGSAEPATFDRKTGKLKNFALPKAGRYPGGWFAAIDPEKGKDLRRGTVVMDQTVNRARHEGGMNKGKGKAGIRTTIRAGARTFSFTDALPGIKGTIHSLAVASGRLYVATKEGTLACLAGTASEPFAHEPTPTPLGAAPDKDAVTLVSTTGWSRGVAIAWGGVDDGLIDALVANTKFQVVVVHPDEKRVRALRTRMDAAGVYGTRIAAHAADPSAFGFSPYLASLIIADDSAAIEMIYPSLRPFGGTACFRRAPEDLAAFEKKVAEATLANAKVRHEGEWTFLIRDGALPGTTNYSGDWNGSRDELVRAPLGVLWFDDTLGHFKRSPQPRFVDGVMVSQPKDWKVEHKAPFSLLTPVHSDAYTGRVLDADDPLVAGKEFPLLNPREEQPYQYRKKKWNGKFGTPEPTVGSRINPMTGQTESRKLSKSYGCDGGVDYGFIYSMRSGTAGFYDKRVESGTINISGPRSGCTNSVIPANGLLNLPYFYEGCTCSYPLPSGVALVSMPPTHEQWASWGESTPKEIQRVGLNFGAPGDRMTDAGTLWLDVPSAGGPSPALDLTTSPAKPSTFYRHSVRIEGGRGWPWVAASGVEGVTSITLGKLKASEFTVRLTFAEPHDTAPGARVFDVALQGRTVLTGLDVAKETGGPMRALTREFSGVESDGSLKIEFAAKKGVPLISGIELIAEGLAPGALPKLNDRSR